MTASEGERALAMHIGWMKLPEPKTEYRFHDTRKWRFDFAWPAVKVAVEVEGGTFVAGRHSRGVAFESDAEKYAEATIGGWAVLRVTTDMVNDGRAVLLLNRLLQARGMVQPHA